MDLSIMTWLITDHRRHCNNKTCNYPEEDCPDDPPAPDENNEIITDPAIYSEDSPH